MIRTAYLEAATSAVTLLGDPAVAKAWRSPSVLREFDVCGLAGHIARQVVLVPGVLAAAVPGGQPITLVEHYTRSAWVGGDIDDEVNTRIRRDAGAEAAGGPQELVARTAAVLGQLRELLSESRPGGPVYLPWGPWSLSLDDFLVTRMIEFVVHSDDLAISVGVDTPTLSDTVLDPVFTALTRIAAHRHGVTAVLRALSRSERAPDTISAF